MVTDVWSGPAPTPVEVMRPRRSTVDLIVMALTAVVSLAVRGWIAMLALPALDLHPGYWTSVLLCLGARALVGSDDQYRYWTREPRR